MSNQPDEYQFTQDEVDSAVNQEEMERLLAENQHFKTRVVKLRALTNKLRAELAELTEPTEAGEGVTPTDE